MEKIITKVKSFFVGMYYAGVAVFNMYADLIMNESKWYILILLIDLILVPVKLLIVLVWGIFNKESFRRSSIAEWADEMIYEYGELDED